jgi:hypothetical protein
MSTEITFDDKHIYCGTTVVADVRQDLPTVYRRELEGFLRNRNDAAVHSALCFLIDSLAENEIDNVSIDDAVGVLIDAGLVA